MDFVYNYDIATNSKLLAWERLPEPSGAVGNDTCFSDNSDRFFLKPPDLRNTAYRDDGLEPSTQRKNATGELIAVQRQSAWLIRKMRVAAKAPASCEWQSMVPKGTASNDTPVAIGRSRGSKSHPIVRFRSSAMTHVWVALEAIPAAYFAWCDNLREVTFENGSSVSVRHWRQFGWEPVPLWLLDSVHSDRGKWQWATSSW
jgi:hypothetical protein